MSHDLKFVGFVSIGPFAVNFLRSEPFRFRPTLNANKKDLS